MSTKSQEVIQENMKTSYLNDNLEILHNLTLELKEYYEYLGLMSFLETHHILEILHKTIFVSQVENEECEDDEEYEIELEEKNIFL